MAGQPNRHRPFEGGRLAPPPAKREALSNDFDPTDFENAIERMGYAVTWEHASRCPCRNNPETSQPSIVCPVCDGDGWEHHSPQPIKAIVDALDTNMDALIAFGTWTFGTARFTVRHEHRPGDRDRYTLTESVLQFSEIRKRSAAVRERLRYPIATIRQDLMVENSAGELVKRPQVPLNVLRLRLMDPATRLPGPVIHRGEDFDVIDGRLDFSRGDLRGTAPGVGALFAVTYYHHPRYVVETIPHAIRDSRVHVPTLAGGTRKHLPLPLTVLAKLDHDTAQPGGSDG